MLGWVGLGQLALVVGWVAKVMGWVELGYKKWTHVHVCGRVYCYKIMHA